MDNGKRVQAIDRAAMILKLFSENTRELKLTEISEQLDLHKSTTFGILNTLKYHGLIRQNEENQKYCLGTYLLELGNLVLNSMDIHQIASPVLSELRNSIEETVHLGMLDGLEVIYIDKQESYQSMRIFTTIGTRNPAYCTGVGKAMLAFQDPEIIQHKLPDELRAFTKYTITSKEALMQNLKEVKVNGYAMDFEERIEGLTCVAAPIFDYMGQVRYAISVSGPTIRMTEEKIEKTIGILRSAADEISKKLGYRG
jgi:DNA-binding IclR family transcriptional regulator